MNNYSSSLRSGFILAVFLANFACQIALADQIKTPILELPDISQWEENSFSGNTEYKVVTNENGQALRAVSNNSASGLARKISIDLNKTPYLHWEWRVENVLHDIDETAKEGDDYAARVYVVISGGFLFWKTRALNYVWSSNQPINTAWLNAYTSNATLIAQQSGGKKVGEWVSEKRNVLVDIKQHLGLDNTSIDAVAIMTDTDNSGQSATAYYRNIHFSSE